MILWGLAMLGGIRRPLASKLLSDRYLVNDSRSLFGKNEINLQPNPLVLSDDSSSRCLLRMLHYVRRFGWLW